MAKSKVSVEMTGDASKLLAAIDRVEQKNRQLEAQIKKGGRAAAAAGRKSQAAFNPAKVTAFASAISLGGGSIVGALGMARQAYESFNNLVKRSGEEARLASGEIAAFAALQAGGTKAGRVFRAGALGAQFGIQRGEAFQTIQAIQSGIEGAATTRGEPITQQAAFEQAMGVARGVFTATKLDVPIETGREAVLQGLVAGEKDPLSFLRMAYAGGQASLRDPKQITQALPGISFFDDKNFGASVATVLAGKFGEETRTFARQAALALTDVEGRFAQLGLGPGATQVERLDALVSNGIDSLQELKGLGFNNIRMLAALDVIVNQRGDVARVSKIISEQAKPGLFPGQISGVERELPGSRLSRIGSGLKAETANIVAGLSTDPERRRTALRLQRRDALNQASLAAAKDFPVSAAAAFVDEEDDIGWFQGPMLDLFTGGGFSKRRAELQRQYGLTGPETGFEGTSPLHARGALRPGRGQTIHRDSMLRGVSADSLSLEERASRVNKQLADMRIAKEMGMLGDLQVPGEVGVTQGPGGAILDLSVIVAFNAALHNMTNQVNNVTAAQQGTVVATHTE